MKFLLLISVSIIFSFAQQTEKQDKVIVATLLKKNIYMEDIDLPARDKQETKKDFEDTVAYEKWLWGARSQNLSEKIIGKLFNKYVVDNKLAPTKSDIESFFSDMKLRQERLKKEYEIEKQKLIERLNTADEKEEEERIKFDLSNIEYEIRVQDLKVSTWMASSFVRSWKMNHSLYQKYGGRVIFQQVGPEPLDAYREFLKDSEKNGDFQILEQKLQQGFWEYFTSKTMHRYYSEEEGKKIMLHPWWK